MSMCIQHKPDIFFRHLESIDEETLERLRIGDSSLQRMSSLVIRVRIVVDSNDQSVEIIRLKFVCGASWVGHM